MEIEIKIKEKTKEEKLWKYLKEKLKVLDDNNETASDIFKYMINLIK